ncbi:TBC1 domain family member 10B-like [Mobula birostris]|uniref:TBC1 domain family member 10B-like n=1 Tax=Mobula birostris TaxID=1983395 RepID=UPI003B2853B3
MAGSPGPLPLPLARSGSASDSPSSRCAPQSADRYPGSARGHTGPGGTREHGDRDPGNARDDQQAENVHERRPRSVHDDGHPGGERDDQRPESVHDARLTENERDDQHLESVHEQHPGFVQDDRRPGSEPVDQHPGSVHEDSQSRGVHGDQPTGSMHDDKHPRNVCQHPESVHKDQRTPSSVHSDREPGSVHEDRGKRPGSVHEPAEQCQVVPGSVPGVQMPPSLSADPSPLAVDTDPCPPKISDHLCPPAVDINPSPLVPHPLSPQHQFRAQFQPDALSVADSVCGGLDSVSLYGTVESLLPEDTSSLGSDSEVNGSTASGRRTDKYGFLGGAQFSSGLESAIAVDVARMREMKWLEMLNRWDKWVARRFDKVKLRCRKGIPSSLRARAWQELSRSKQLMDQNPGKFEELDRQPGDPKWLDIIEKDLHRQFPFHEMFALRGGHGQQDLYRILKAYTVYQPDEGYCQAQAPVAAVLLMHMPAEQAFWCLVQICEKYLPGYYSAGLEAIQLDGEVLSALLRRVSPLAYRHLKKHKIDPILYMTEWFMCIFARTLPWSSVLRVWDMFFCDGVKIIFKVGLVLLKHLLGSADKLRDCQGMYETMEKLRNAPGHSLHEDILVHEVISLKVPESLIEREHRTQRQRWSAERGELRNPHCRRLYGARALREEETRLNPLLSSASPSLLSLTASLVSLRRPKEPPRPPSPTPTQLSQPLVVSEGLHPSLPSPASSPPAPFGQGKAEGGGKEGESKKERKEREREERRERKEREKEEKERERRERQQQKNKKKKPPAPSSPLPTTPSKGPIRSAMGENGASQGGGGVAEGSLRDRYF